MRGSLVILFWAFTQFGLSQIPVNTDLWNRQNTIGFSTGLNATSADFNNAFAMSLTQDEVLTAQLVSNQFERLESRKMNSVGLDYETTLFASIPIRASSHSFLFRMSDAAHLHAKIPTDAFSAVFQGNKAFAGDTMSFSDANALGMRYQKVGVGWQYAPSVSTQIYGVANYVNGEQLLDLNVERGTLFTSPLGDTINADILASYVQSDTANAGFARPNGGGFSIDFGFLTTLQGEKTNWDLKFNVMDLGIIQWQSQTIISNVDTIVNWTGVALPQIDQIDNAFTDGLTDSLTSSINQLSKRGKYSQWLAGTFHAQILQSRLKGLEWGGGTVVRWNAGYDPFAYLLGGYQINDFVDCHAILGYGGYGEFQLGLQAAASFEKLQASLSIQNLEGWLLSNSYLGASGRFTIQYLF